MFAARGRTSGHKLATMRIAVMGFVIGCLGTHIGVAPGQHPMRENDSTSQAAPPAPARIVTVEGITEYRLDNGLRVLLCPDPSRPTITLNMVYLVGSRHEGRGETGMAHLLEHMSGRGTDAYESLIQALVDRGADFNGTTWFDRTHYYETLSAGDGNLEFALQIEAERMARLKIMAEELAEEMRIVTNEFELIENAPRTILSQRMMSSAYLWHHYGKTTIGNLSDIQRYPIENLRRFYEAYYQPDNAVLVVAGKIDVDQAVGLINKHLGAIPRPKRALSDTYTEEPPQDGPRRVTLRRAGDLAVAGLLYHVPAGTHPDAAALQVLRDILVSEPSGRLYKALVKTGMATTLRGDGDLLFLAEPGVMEIMAEARLDRDIQKVQTRMIEVVEGLARDGVSQEEVERVKGRRLKNIRRATADTRQLAIDLTEWIALGDWRTFFIHRDRLREVTAADVERVARTYLIESNRTAGLFMPDKEPVRATIPPVPDVGRMVEGYRGREALKAGEAFVATPENICERTMRMVIEPGMKIALLQKDTRGDMVRAEFRFHFGNEDSLRGHRKALGLIPTLLERGTTSRNYQQLQDEIDRLQSDVSIGGGTGTFGVSIESDREHIVPAIALAAEMLQEPSFPAGQFDVIRNEQLAKLEKGLSDPQERCFDALRRALYPWPPENIHYMPTLEERIERLKNVSLGEVKDLYDRFYGGGHSEVSVVGDFDKGAVLKALGEHFGLWKSRAPYERIAMPHRPANAQARTIITPDKQMAVVAMGTHLEMRDDHPDYPALRFASYIFGESSKCRLSKRLRFEEALTYHVRGYARADDQDHRTSVFAYSFCSPKEADRVLAGMREELNRWISDGVTAKELTSGKSSFAEEFFNQLTDDAFVASRLVEELEIDRTFVFDQAMLEKIESLTESDIQRSLQQHLGKLQWAEIRAGDFR